MYSWTDPDVPLLTAQQVRGLPEGSIIEVRWRGGNGPHRYELGYYRDRFGTEEPVALTLHPHSPETARQAFRSRQILRSRWSLDREKTLDHEVRLVHSR